MHIPEIYFRSNFTKLTEILQETSNQVQLHSMSVQYITLIYFNIPSHLFFFLSQTCWEPENKVKMTDIIKCLDAPANGA